MSFWKPLCRQMKRAGLRKMIFSLSLNYLPDSHFPWDWKKLLDVFDVKTDGTRGNLSSSHLQTQLVGPMCFGARNVLSLEVEHLPLSSFYPHLSSSWSQKCVSEIPCLPLTQGNSFLIKLINCHYSSSHRNFRGILTLLTPAFNPMEQICHFSLPNPHQILLFSDIFIRVISASRLTRALA